jgi:hypothetical protein
VTKTKSKKAGKNDDDSDEDPKAKSQAGIMKDIKEVHFCQRCQKPCMIDPGPPVKHRPFTMEELSLWTGFVVCHTNDLIFHI